MYVYICFCVLHILLHIYFSKKNNKGTYQCLIWQNVKYEVKKKLPHILPHMWCQIYLYCTFHQQGSSKLTIWTLTLT